MWIGGEPAALGKFLAEIVQVLFRETAFEIGAGVVAGRGVALEKYDVRRLAFVAAAEAMVLRDFVKCRGRRESRDVSAKAVVLAVGVDDHRHGVPANKALDAGFDAP